MNLFDLIFPIFCLECKKNGRYICKGCLSKVRLAKGLCPECNKASIDGFTHTGCQKAQGINGLMSLWKYEGVIRKVILALKYKYATDVVDEIGRCIDVELQSKSIQFFSEYVLTPVPLNWYRQNERGFNQAHLLGKAIATKAGWRFVSDLLIRKKYTQRQVGLKGRERIINIRHAFAVNNITYPQLPKACILFDDVYTTGSTLKEAGMVLKRNGVEQVWGLTIAR